MDVHIAGKLVHLDQQQVIGTGDLTRCEERALRIARRANPNDLTDNNSVLVLIDHQPMAPFDVTSRVTPGNRLRVNH